MGGLSPVTVDSSTMVNKGFEVIDAVETDIGDGYIMDDYIMEKKLQ